MRSGYTFSRFFFCSFLTVGTFTAVFKDNKSIRNHKTAEIRVLFSLDNGMIRIRTNKIITSPNPGGPKSYGSYGSGSGTLLDI